MNFLKSFLQHGPAKPSEPIFWIARGFLLLLVLCFFSAVYVNSRLPTVEPSTAQLAHGRQATNGDRVFKNSVEKPEEVIARYTNLANGFYWDSRDCHRASGWCAGWVAFATRQLVLGAEETAERQLRAFINLDTAHLMIDDDRAVIKNEFTLDIVFRNFGKTPLTMSKWSMKLYCWDVAVTKFHNATVP